MKPQKDNRSPLLQMGYSVFNRVRNRVAGDNQWRCSYCSEEVSTRPANESLLATLSKDVPISRGGEWKRFNLKCACRKCNEEKGNMTDAEFRYYRFLTGKIKPE